LQTWCDLLNTLISQAPPTPDELTDASPLYRRSNASPTPRHHPLFQPPPPQQEGILVQSNLHSRVFLQAKPSRRCHGS
jgi:hypothetical protein